MTDRTFMPSRTKMKNAAIAAKSAALPKIPNELIDQFVTGPMTGEAMNAASLAFKKALIERLMGGRAGPSPGLPHRRCQTWHDRQPAQRQERQDRPYRRGARAHRGAARPGRQLRAHPDS